MKGWAVGGVVLCCLLLAAGYAYYPWPREAEPLQPAPVAEREPEAVTPPVPLPVAPLPAATPAESPEAATPPPPAPPHEAAHEHDALDDPFGDLALYAEYPMSDVPHRVVRAWGASGGTRSPGHVGAFVVVDPSIDDASLRKLARDIRDYHRNADAVGIRIVDSEEAATYDRHVDGGELLQAHVVGRVQRNDALGTENSEVRGEPLGDDEP